jgi:enoyl-CoA hydratase
MKDSSLFRLERRPQALLVQLCSEDGTNRLTRELVLALTYAVRQLAQEKLPVVITGNEKFFSAGADLAEIAALDGPAVFEFSRMGQELMRQVDEFPAPVAATICGYCMGGGLDLALACRYRIASPHAIFGHRGTALGLITGWGGTQRLPRLIGKARALEIFVTAEKITAPRALKMGLVDTIAEDPVAEAMRRVADARCQGSSG